MLPEHSNHRGARSYSMFRLNLDLRLGIAYNWRNFFFGIQAQ